MGQNNQRRGHVKLLQRKADGIYWASRGNQIVLNSLYSQFQYSKFSCWVLQNSNKKEADKSAPTPIGRTSGSESPILNVNVS